MISLAFSEGAFLVGWAKWTKGLPVREVRVDPATALEAVKTWPVEERLAFLFRVWDQLIEGGWQPELSDDLKAELDRRLAAHAADPSRVLTWEQVVTHVRRPR